MANTNANVVTVLWNGGWDQYIVDSTTVRPMTEEEQQRYTVGNERYFPTFSANGADWIKGCFLDSPSNQAVCPIGKNDCVKILRHVGGGD